MGFFRWLFGDGDSNHHNISVEGNNNNAYQDNSVRINYGGDGRTCPYDWQLSYATCGCCPRLHTCKEGRGFLDSERRRMSDYD